MRVHWLIVATTLLAVANVTFPAYGQDKKTYESGSDTTSEPGVTYRIRLDVILEQKCICRCEGQDSTGARFDVEVEVKGKAGAGCTAVTNSSCTLNDNRVGTMEGCKNDYRPASLIQLPGAVFEMELVR